MTVCKRVGTRYIGLLAQLFRSLNKIYTLAFEIKHIKDIRPQSEKGNQGLKINIRIRTGIAIKTEVVVQNVYTKLQ